MYAFTQKILDSRTFPNPPATFVKQRMDSTSVEWRLSAKERAHLKEILHQVTTPALLDTSFCKDLQDLARKKPERVHARQQKTKSQKIKTEKYAPSFFPSCRSSKVRPFDTGSSAGRSD